VALSLLAGVGVGAGAVVGNLLRASGPPLEHAAAKSPIDQPATVAATPPPQAPLVAAAPAAPQNAGVQVAALPQTAPPGGRVQKAVARPTPKPKPVKKISLTPLSPREQWERQQVDYEIARAAYDANERKEGYRWAQENNIRLQRYCRVAAQRTAAFVDGCLSYSNRGRGDKPEPQGASDQG
jgi:hypothetical protein